MQISDRQPARIPCSRRTASASATPLTRAVFIPNSPAASTFSRLSSRNSTSAASQLSASVTCRKASSSGLILPVRCEAKWWSKAFSNFIRPITCGHAWRWYSKAWLVYIGAEFAPAVRELPETFRSAIELLPSTMHLSPPGLTFPRLADRQKVPHRCVRSRTLSLPGKLAKSGTTLREQRESPSRRSRWKRRRVPRALRPGRRAQLGLRVPQAALVSVQMLFRKGRLPQRGNQLRRSRHSSGFGFRVDRFPVGDHGERTRAAHLYFDGYLQFALDVLFQAHGLCLDILSEEAAFDFDRHGWSLVLWRSSLADLDCASFNSSLQVSELQTDNS